MASGGAMPRSNASPGSYGTAGTGAESIHSGHTEKELGDSQQPGHSSESNTVETTPGDAEKQALGFTRLRKASIFTVLGLNAFFVMICLSIMIPFFPTEAAEKDPSPGSVDGLTAIGFIFSITAFVEFLTAPVVGKILPCIGPKIVVALGGVLVCGAVTLFGFVDRIDDWTTFLGICYALRAVQGVGTALNQTASFALLVGVFPKSISLISGLLRAFTGLGFMIGPALSGFIYDEHGFLYPFVIYGGVMLCSSVAILFVLPGEVEANEDRKDAGIFTATLKLPWSLLWLFASLVVGAAVGLLEPSISPYLREEFHLTPSEVGLVFLLHSAIFIITAPITGLIGDRYVKPKRLVVVGAVIQGGGLLLLGPVKTAGVLEPALWRSVFAMAIIGGGSGIFSTCLAPGMLNAMYAAGFADSVELHATAAGMITAFHSLGIAVGPTVGNALTAVIGFPDSAAVFGLIVLLNALLFVSFDVYEQMRQSCCKGNAEDEERRPLLGSGQEKSTTF